MHQYSDRSSQVEYTNWASNSYIGDSSRDMILVTGDSNDGGSSIRGEWIAGHAQADSKFYSIIEYSLPIEVSVILENGNLLSFFSHIRPRNYEGKNKI